MIWKIIGISAATLSMFSFLPQIAKALRTKSVKDMSPLTLFQLALGVCLWALYGVHLKDAIIIIANIITLLSLLTLILLYYNYKGVAK